MSHDSIFCLQKLNEDNSDPGSGMESMIEEKVPPVQKERERKKISFATHGWIGAEKARGKFMLEEGAEMQWHNKNWEY